MEVVRLFCWGKIQMLKLNENELDGLAGKLSELNGLRLAIVYGSAACGKMRADSDIDIALLFSQPMKSKEKMGIIELLSECTDRSLDLIDLYDLNGTILKQVLCTGKVIFRDGSNARYELMRRMIFNQADMMPYVLRTLKQRQERFING